MRVIDVDKARKFLGREGDGKAVIRVLRLKKLQDRLGVGRSTVYDWMNPCSPRYNPAFPRPIKLSIGARGAIGWIESDICRWIDSRVVAGVEVLRRGEQ
ncbi:AlpA family phage regulatory protein [Pseudomonas sp. RTC3]|uniref:helix-turn-helix transcriptional regulator n=1 Tax=Pseudomonas sp. 5C2 TaxID=3048588 RepID=UPI002AB543B3|nr:AlpA family phage regulatory protein [Pseudomonas sp. 5C2]MDY7566652.1 AlpA family phage regulatory protein [Pseudomonas sp. 5C2]MEB0061573.1 AlpA family phage regulatory protein [Pseudomonas sp. RTC3]MEB0240625.1 AlpA family phage regulatory protein [Pseudomonas sp. 5C2]